MRGSATAPIPSLSGRLTCKGIPSNRTQHKRYLGQTGCTSNCISTRIPRNRCYGTMCRSKFCAALNAMTGVLVRRSLFSSGASRVAGTGDLLKGRDDDRISFGSAKRRGRRLYRESPAYASQDCFYGHALDRHLPKSLLRKSSVEVWVRPLFGKEGL